MHKKCLLHDCRHAADEQCAMHAMCNAMRCMPSQVKSPGVEPGNDTESPDYDLAKKLAADMPKVCVNSSCSHLQSSSSLNLEIRIDPVSQKQTTSLQPLALYSLLSGLGIESAQIKLRLHPCRLCCK